MNSPIVVQNSQNQLIHRKMALIMAEVAPIAKERKNTQQGYSFRGVDDVYQALQHIMAKHGVYSLPTVLEDRTEERTTKSGTALIYRVLKILYTFYAEDGSFVQSTVIGEGMDSGDKASNKAMSVADKYCLLQAFKIPTAEPKDPENDSPEVTPRGGKVKHDPKEQEREALAALFEAENIPRVDWGWFATECRKVPQAEWPHVVAALKSKGK